MLPEAAVVRDENEYVLRQLQPRDVEGYLELYETIWGPTHTRWFQWRFKERTPVDHVPVFVATTDGDVVATRPFFVLPNEYRRDGDAGVTDRRYDGSPRPPTTGAFTALTEASIQWYARRGRRSCLTNPPRPHGPGS